MLHSVYLGSRNLDLGVTSNPSLLHSSYEEPLLSVNAVQLLLDVFYYSTSSFYYSAAFFDASVLQHTSVYSNCSEFKIFGKFRRLELLFRFLKKFRNSEIFHILRRKFPIQSKWEKVQMS